MRRTFAPLLCLTLLAACGTDDATTARSGPPPRPTGTQDVVVEVMVSGGLVPASYAVTAIPSATVLGDGTVITSAPVPAIYPGPAIQPLQQTKVDGKTVDGLVERARSLGLLEGELDFGRPPVADAPDTEVTIVAGGTTHRHVANALGIADEQSGRPGASSGLTAEAVANRKALNDFVQAVQALPPGDKPWTPPAVAVYDLGAYQADPNLPQRPVPWPLASPPNLSGSPNSRACTLVQGPDVATLLRALGSANALTPWVVAGSEHSLAFRPVLPGQPRC